MAPPRSVDDHSSISYTPEYNAFIEKLKAYHEKRGTPFEQEPKVGSKLVDLLQLFNMTMERGGYDKVSDTKLAWRKLGEDFGLPQQHLPALSFALKSVYYRNLAAYEISTVHGKEPPPREILEDLTAKGGGLLSRTVENFRPSARRDTAIGNENSEASGDDGTPARERHDSEETPGSGGRITRGLRQAPPQRVLFQPDTQPSRNSRNVSATSHPPNHHQQPHQSHNQPQQIRGASSYNQSASMENQSTAVANYEPRPQMPLTLRPVHTPGNNPVEFARRQKLAKEAHALLSGQVAPVNKGIMFPGTGFDGPNIYVRCLCALRSGIPYEQDYALHHLVKISMERGDKYKFDSFPGLVEALVEKVLEVGSLFYQVEWRISYINDGSTTGPNVLNGVDGTPDILQRIKALVRLPVDDTLQPAEFSDHLLQINEAALTIRNMVLLEENASYASDLAPVKDFLSVALNLPVLDSVIELKHYALDIAEQITKYLSLEQNDPLYISLLDQLHSDDRGAILTALRAIIRISMNLDSNNLLKGVPKTVVQNIINWTLLADEELIHACLDFLYQYTAVISNVEFLMNELDIEPLISQLTRLLTWGVKTYEQGIAVEPEYKLPAPQENMIVPQELVVQLLRYEEPDRSSHWLRCLYEEDQDESITQIALWQAYQQQFSPSGGPQLGVPTLAAADFIKNVSTTFADKANAQVQQGTVQRFIIKGIRRRTVPIDTRGDEFRRCNWHHPASTTTCGKFYLSPQQMYLHILQDHLHAIQTEDGKFNNSAVGTYRCQWHGCRRFHAEPATKLSQIASHIKVHLPPVPTVAKEPTELPAPPPSKKLKLSYLIPAKKRPFKHTYTAMDEAGQAAGIPLTALLVLRNLARKLPKTDAEEDSIKVGRGSLVQQLFKPYELKLFEIHAHNKVLSPHMIDLLAAIKDTEA